MRAMIFSLAAFCVACSPGISYADIIVQTTFDTDRQNWTVTFPAATGIADFWQPTGGNPGGTVRSFDQAGSSGSRSWFFDNNITFNGNRSTAFNGTLSFDLRSNGTGTAKTNLPTFPSFSYDVLISNGAFGFLAYRTLPSPTGDVWTSYSLALNDTAGWRFSPNFSSSPPSWGAATNAQIQSVLGNITDLQIRGDYWSSDETTFLDNVALASGVPEPGAITLACLGMMGVGVPALRRRRKRSATSV